ncbi:hypothetical protein [Hydrogenobacter thermophilus]|uniref:hypothetical protein n=1 Tax=Hydrogenobacter thermophilus TaxID=940 RepID=UPI0030F9E219
MKKLILCLGIFSFAFAQDDLESLKRQLEEQKRLIQELEKKIEALEKAQKGQKEETRQETEAKEKTKPVPADRTLQLRVKYDERLKAYQIYPFKQTAFLPDISFIMDTSLVGRNRNDQTYKQLEIPGFWHPHGDNSEELNKNRGFNLNYGELYLYAPVDPYFDLYVTIPFSEDSSQIEEAYAVTRGLPGGFQLKVGKFRSSFGRLNSQHPHVWDFATLPLPYKVFLGDDGLVEKGIQINWLAPTPFYLLFGLEVLQGENEQSFGTNGFSINTKKDGSGTNLTVGDARKPNLYVGFIKTSFDIGNLSILTGISYAQGKTRLNHIDTDEPHAFSGSTKLYGLDLTAKYFIDSYRYVSFQSEYIYRDQKGTRYAYDDLGDLVTPSVSKKQGGFYSQLVWRFAQRWRAGIQYNLLNKNDVKVDGVKQNFPGSLPAYYAMLEFNPTEFSRIRLQVGQNRALYYEGMRKTVNEVILQFNFAIGAHGAHPF